MLSPISVLCRQIVIGRNLPGYLEGKKIFAYFAMKSNNEMVETGKSPAHHFC